jgi:CRP-like cAMP-binding protein
MRPIVEDDLFGKVGSRERQAIDGFFSMRHIPAKNVIFEQGSSPTEMWVMVSGSAIFTQRSSSNQTLDRSVSPGEVLGLTEILAEVPHYGTLTTIIPCEFRTIDNATFLELLNDRPRVRSAILKTLATNYLESYLRMAKEHIV